MSSETAKPQRLSAMNIAFIGFILVSVLFGAFQGTLKAVTEASVASAKDAVTLAISLIGFMAFWLGLTRVLEAGGLMYSLARLVKPVMVRLFPDVPPEHPAMGAMLLNISANMLGLGNAATPLGIKAMTELNRLNPLPGTATNAMCLFLAINTTSVTLMPLGAIGVRAAAGAADPAAIFLPTLFATTMSTTVGVLVALFYAKRDRKYREAVVGKRAVDVAEAAATDLAPDYSHLQIVPSKTGKLIAQGSLLLFLVAMIYHLVRADDRLTFFLQQILSFWLLPFLMLAVVAYGLARGVKVYEAVTEGAKQGFDVAVRIIPFLVAILVSIAMFRASGAMGLLEQILAPVTNLINLPPAVLPVAILRPLTGSGSFAVFSSLTQQAPDSYDAFLAATIQGSSETTFYVLAVYFGAVGVTRIRHALIAGLIGDLAGVLASCAICTALWQG